MQRTLSIQSPAIPVLLGQPTLEAVRLSGNEGINSLFAYELLLKTPDALNLGASGAMDFDLDSFIGREITCSIQLDGAGQFVPGVAGQSLDHIGAGVRQINALITDVEVWGEEGRHVQYMLTLRPGCTWPPSPPTAGSIRTRAWSRSWTSFLPATTFPWTSA